MPKLKALSLSQFQHFAQKFGRRFYKRNAVIGLSGPLGGGKTTFVKNFAQAFGIKMAKSPTFVILNVYPNRQRDLYHLDCYRLHKSSQLNPLGLAEIFDQPKRIVLIEWVEKFPQLVRRCNILIHLTPTTHAKRSIIISYQ